MYLLHVVDYGQLILLGAEAFEIILSTNKL